MTWLALLLIGFGLADLGHALRPVRWLPEAVAALLTLGIGALAGIEGGRAQHAGVARSMIGPDH